MSLFAWFALLVVCVLVVVAGLWWFRERRRPAEPEPLPDAWPLQSRPVFNSEERRIYRQLVDTFPHHAVLVKLPLVRFCQPEEPQELRYWHRLLGSQSVTFALCSPSGRVVAVIDLETARPPSERSLRVKQEVLSACRVRYLRCHPDRLPSPAELQLLVPQPHRPRVPLAAPSRWSPQPMRSSSMRRSSPNFRNSTTSRRLNCWSRSVSTSAASIHWPAPDSTP